VETIEELSLKSPFELLVVEIPGVQLEDVGMYWRVGESRPDDDFHSIALGAGVELEERMLVEAELLLHPQEMFGRHARIVD